MITYLRNKIQIENEEIKKIAETIEKYNLLFRDIANSPVGKYSINTILETVEESLNYLEIYTPNLKKWIEEYLELHRGELWLYYGIERGLYLSHHWKISESNFSELSSMWPFLYDRKDSNSNYKDFIVDLREAQNEVLRQRKRQDTSNPNYKPYHPNGCQSSCSCWMLDDTEQWYKEEQEEIAASKNIFFNGKLQSEFYKAAIEELGELKEQWSTWKPESYIKTYNTKLSTSPGQTPITIVIEWITNDFQYSRIFSMFHLSDIFKDIWENIDSVDSFIGAQREKLKKIVELL